MVAKNPRKDGEYINSLARGLAVLRSFTRERPEMTLSEVAVQTELNPAVVRRCLNTLHHLGYVGKKGKLFLLRPEVLSIGSAYLESMNLEEAVQPTLQKVRDNTGNSTALAVLSGSEALFLVYVSTKTLARIAAGVGTRFPLYNTAAGRVLLAFQEKEKIEDYFKNTEIVQHTETTETSLAKLKTLLNKVKKQGYSSIKAELDYGIVSVSVPIFNEDNNIVASIVCSTSTGRKTEEEMVKAVVPELQKAAQEIELELRRSPMLVHSILP